MKFNDNTTIGFIYIFSLLLLFSIGSILQIPKIRRISKYCFIKCPLNLWGILKQYRGSNYYLDENDRKTYDVEPNCLFTFWGVTHVILYMIIGFFAPKKFWLTFFIGIIFEFLENMTYECHDILDLIWNSIGFFIGAKLHDMYFN